MTETVVTIGVEKEGDQPEAKRSPFEGLSDPLEVSGKIAEHLAAKEAVDWTEVLKAVGVMREEDGTPKPGASELGATAVKMIAEAEVTQRNQHIVDDLGRVVGRFEDVAGVVHADVHKLGMESENLHGTGSRIASTSDELDGVARRLNAAANDLSTALPQHRVDQLADAAYRMQSVSRGY